MLTMHTNTRIYCHRPALMACWLSGSPPVVEIVYYPVTFVLCALLLGKQNLLLLFVVVVIVLLLLLSIHNTIIMC